MKKIIIIVIATIIVTALLTTLILVVMPKAEPQAIPEETPEVIETPEVEELTYKYELEEAFVTNMKDSNRFVKASFILILTVEEDITTLVNLDYIVKDTIIRILRSTTEEEYLEDEIQDNLRDRIRRELVKTLEMDSIKDVFFLELVIQ